MEDTMKVLKLLEELEDIVLMTPPGCLFQTR